MAVSAKLAELVRDATIVHRIGRACGLEVTPHMLRHSCASQLLRSGMSLPALSKQLGHASMRSTERYLHLMTEDLQREYRDVSPVTVIMGQR
jgi:site-specific recombinase XerD